jgi:hypothetical protein
MKNNWPNDQINPSEPPLSRTTGHKSRHVAELSNVPFLGRTGWMSRLQQVASQAPPDAQFPRLLAFLKFWKWIIPYLRDFVHANAPYHTYGHGQTGIFRVGMQSRRVLRMAVVSDWGTGTLEAESVAENMMGSCPHLTIHLGDVYYMGEMGEIRENCLGEATKSYTGVCWPRGSLGSLALMGNHEMYSGGMGYFLGFLPGLGVSQDDESVTTSQRASYFCVETPGWIILGLDTGYHSGGVPAFTSIPGLNSIPALNVDARFDARMLAWLRRTLHSLQSEGSGDKPIIVLTHHQPLSSFEHAFRKPAAQLDQPGLLNGREFVWLFGHEHRMTVYAKQTLANSLTVYPRCIGHGGMPVEITRLRKPDPRILFYDPRRHPIDKIDRKTLVGYNGHVVLNIDGAELKIEYRDIDKNQLLLTETFIPDASGALKHSYLQPAGSGLATGAHPVAVT